MGKIFAAPECIPSPGFDLSEGIDAYHKRNQAYVESVQQWARDNGRGALRGETVRFPVADGYAQYVVLSTAPVRLIHLQVGDAWHFEYADRLSSHDVKVEVKRRRELEALFSKR